MTDPNNPSAHHLMLRPPPGKDTGPSLCGNPGTTVLMSKNVTCDVCSEILDLRRWKAEALPVISGLQELGRALGLGYGQRITGSDAVAAAKRLSRTAAAKALRDAAHDLDLGQTEPHTREDRIGAAGAPDWLRERAARIEGSTR